MASIPTNLTALQVQSAVDALRLAYLAQTLTVRFTDGRMVTYQSSDAMLKAIQTGEDWIRSMSGQGATRVAFAQHKRGDGPDGPGRLFDEW